MSTKKAEFDIAKHAIASSLNLSAFSEPELYTIFIDALSCSVCFGHLRCSKCSLREAEIDEHNTLEDFVWYTLQIGERVDLSIALFACAEAVFNETNRRKEQTTLEDKKRGSRRSKKKDGQI